MSTAVFELTDLNFGEEIAGSDLPVLVEFWAPWCAPCRALTPVVESLAADYAERLLVRKINADENPELVLRYDVAAVPTLLVFREGDVVRHMTGARSRAQLLAELEDVLP